MADPTRTDDLSSETMTAWRIAPGVKEPQRTTLPVPTPGPDEVLVKVLASGVCHSDVHLLRWSDSRPFSPNTHTLGHESAGTVVRLGSAVAADTALIRKRCNLNMEIRYLWIYLTLWLYPGNPSLCRKLVPPYLPQQTRGRLPRVGYFRRRK